MIVRIVHMHFRKEALSSFLALFDEHRNDIAGQPGCRNLQLVQAEQDECAISTISQWDAPEDLEAYRNSALFQHIWPATKALFSASPAASSHTVRWAS